jgi:hypothetical protein
VVSPGIGANAIQQSAFECAASLLKRDYEFKKPSKNSSLFHLKKKKYHELHGPNEKASARKSVRTAIRPIPFCHGKKQRVSGVTEP